MSSAQDDSQLLPVNPQLQQQQPQPSSSTSSKRKKKKRKKSSSSIASESDSASAPTSILHSKLSLKKIQSIKKSTKSTPWYDTNELISTGRDLLLAIKLFPSTSTNHNLQLNNTNASHVNGLTNEEYNQLQNALRRVSIWKARSERGGRLSHAIDMTAGLAGILLLDAQRCSSSSNYNSFVDVNVASSALVSSPTLYQLRNTYSTILLRSVNGLADTYRHQKKSATLSVSHCCALAGLPLWLVDIRHDASHNELPSLNICRLGAIESLVFWKGRYWDVLEEKVWGSSCISCVVVVQGGGGNDSIVGGEGGGASNASSQDESSSPGICTLAYDCLGRFQKAAMQEACDKEEKLPGKQSKMSEKDDCQGKALKEGSTVDKKSSCDAGNNSTGVEEYGDMISLPSAAATESQKPSQEKKSNSNKQAAKADGREKIRANNFWSVLNDDKPKKKRKKTSKSVEKKDDASGATEKASSTAAAVTTSEKPSCSGHNDGTAQASPSTLAAPITSNTMPSSRDCAAEFIRAIPIDVAYSAALRFLVWGGGGSTPSSNESEVKDDDISNGPALLTLPPSLSVASTPSLSTMKRDQDLDTAFECLRVMYDPILIAMTSAYPGFIIALFVHLIDSILCLDDVLCQQQQTEEQSKDDDENEIFDGSQIESNLYYLSRWVRYILSREYHMHFDRSVAMMMIDVPQVRPITTNQQLDESKDALPAQEMELVPPQQQEQKAIMPQQQQKVQIDLKKKGKKKWNCKELEYMQGALDYSALHDIGFPLNSICDRFYGSQQQKRTTIVGDLMQFLEGIIGEEERVSFMGLYDKNDGRQEEVPSSSSNSDLVVKEEAHTQGKTEKVNIDSNEPSADGIQNNVLAKPSGQVSPNNLLSLEDMEAMMMVGADATTTAAIDEKKDALSCNQSSQNTPEKEGTIPMDQCINDSTGCDGSPTITALLPTVKPWTLCKSWDVCAIGTMPGYPS